MSNEQKVMIDAEKIARMVEWIGGWPEHKCVETIDPDAICIRCGNTLLWVRTEGECEAWNPFERIEDAFLLVENLGSVSVEIFCTEPDGAWRCHISREDQFDVLSGFWEDPARAIAEAAWQVINRLDPERGSG